MNGNQTILVPPPEAEERMRKGSKAGDGQKTFAFDRSYWSFDRNDKNFAGQDSLYRDLGVPLLDNAVSFPPLDDMSCLQADRRTHSFKDTTTAFLPTARQDLGNRIV